MDTFELATVTVAGTALVLAPIDPQPIRDLNTPIANPEPIVESAVVTNYDCLGSVWGHDTVTDAEAAIADRVAAGAAIDEWTITALDGQPLRIVRTTEIDTTFLGGVDISVIPA